MPENTAATDATNLVANPSMVGLLRDVHGWTQQELAAKASVSQGFISRVESGLADLTGAQLYVVAEALDAPIELLTAKLPGAGLEVSCMFHRRRTSRVTVAAGKRVEGLGQLTRMTVDRLVDGVPGPDIHLHRMDIGSYSSPSGIAQRARAEWNLPPGPIPDLMELLDTLGVVVVVRDVGTAGQDAFSTWPKGGVPIIVVNTGLPIDRMRFSLAHELGHVLMHVMPNEDQERQANQFASELLMPTGEIREDLAGLTTAQFTRLSELKTKWRVSIGALVQRAHYEEIISDRQFKEFRIRMARMGWDKTEPVELHPERPRLLAHVVELRRELLGEKDDALACTALMTPAAFARHYLAGTDQDPEPQERTTP